MQTYHGSLALACRGDGRDEGHEACEAVDHARRMGELSIAVRNYHEYLQELCSRAVGHGKPGVTTNLLVLQAVLATATAATNRQAACSSPPTDSSHCTTSIQVYSTRIPARRTSATEHRTQDTCDRRTLQKPALNLQSRTLHISPLPSPHSSADTVARHPPTSRASDNRRIDRDHSSCTQPASQGHERSPTGAP